MMGRMRSFACVALALAAACGGSSSSSSSPSPPAASAPDPALAAPAEPDAPSKALRITGLEPVTGAADGGALISIGVENLPASSSVKVYVGIAQAEIVRVGATEIIAKAPGGKPGQKVDVLVIFESGQEITLPGAFTFTSGE